MGKSTVFRLVQRMFQAQAGTVTLDGVPIQDMNLTVLRKSIGVVFQKAMLFNRSVADNIRVGNPDATQEEIEEAAKKANVHDFIMGLNGGYKFIVGKDGDKLNGGTQQRVAIARAILKNAPILLLDEATSSLDEANQEVVMQSLEGLMQGRTSLIIAHRLSTIATADKIVVLKSGELLEQGTHDELMAKGGYYSDAWGTATSTKEQPPQDPSSSPPKKLPPIETPDN